MKLSRLPYHTAHLCPDRFCWSDFLYKTVLDTADANQHFLKMELLPDEPARCFDIVMHFSSRVMLVFSHFFFADEFKKDANLLAEPGIGMRGRYILPTLHDACMNATLMALRDIDDFFALPSNNPRADDLKASDLGFKESLSFLTADERKKINKLIVHSTTDAVKSEEIRWYVDEIISKCLSQSFYFLKWVQANYTLESQQKTLAAARFSELQVTLVVQYANKRKALKKE